MIAAEKKWGRGLELPVARRSRLLAVGMLVPLMMFALGCEGLLDVANPGQIRVEDLKDPALAEVLVFGAQGDFECFFTNWIDVIALWTGDLDGSQARRDADLVMQRHASVFQIEGGENCRGRATSIGGLPLHTARIQADSAIGRISDFPDAEVPDKAFLLGKASVYAGFTYLMAGEAYCELTFDGGPVVSRSATLEIARTRFTDAINGLGGIGGSEAGNLRQAALVGRARASLNLGDDAGVLQDAGAVTDPDFVFYSTHSVSADRRYNQQAEKIQLLRWRSAPAKYHDLEVDGVPDPRIVTEFDGVSDRAQQDHYTVTKYTDRSDPIPIASWREAQLMIAEVQGGQTAVDVINSLRATWGLPEFSSTNDAEIREQVREERRRELYLQTGSRLGDMLRWGEPLPSGLDPLGRPYVQEFTCLPLHLREILNNDNVSG